VLEGTIASSHHTSFDNFVGLGTATFEKGKLIRVHPYKMDILSQELPFIKVKEAISGPPLLFQSQIELIKQRPSAFNHCDYDQVNWDPITTRASWSALGILPSNDTNSLLFLLHLFTEENANGITSSELSSLLLNQYNVTEAILMGGSADGQQFLNLNNDDENHNDDLNREFYERNYLQAQARKGSATKDKAFQNSTKINPQVIGYRDLGASICIFSMD
jgi:hypothetical protein